MRELKITRRKQMEASANKLIVELDGVKHSEKLGNGKSVTLMMDEKAHKLFLHGGFLAGKAFRDEIDIPAGRYAYDLQVEMLSLTNGYKPVLRAMPTQEQKGGNRTNLLLGSTLLRLLLDEKLRKILTDLPGADLHLDLQADQWQLSVVLGQQRKALVSQPYSKISGGLLGAVWNAADHAMLATPETRAELTEKIGKDYVESLPDYEYLGEGIIRFKGE